MEITDKNHPLYLSLERFVDLESHDPDLLVKIIQTRLDQGIKEIYRKSKQAGIPVTYRDEHYPDGIVREEADGRRFLIRLNNQYQETVIREIPPRSKP